MKKNRESVEELKKQESAVRMKVLSAAMSYNPLEYKVPLEEVESLLAEMQKVAPHLNRRKILELVQEFLPPLNAINAYRGEIDDIEDDASQQAPKAADRKTIFPEEHIPSKSEMTDEEWDRTMKDIMSDDLEPPGNLGWRAEPEPQTEDEDEKESKSAAVRPKIKRWGKSTAKKEDHKEKPSIPVDFFFGSPSYFEKTDMKVLTRRAVLIEFLNESFGFSNGGRHLAEAKLLSLGIEFKTREIDCDIANWQIARNYLNGAPRYRKQMEFRLSESTLPELEGLRCLITDGKRRWEDLKS